MTTASFDRVAGAYDDLWTNTAIGRLQRAAVWRHAANVFTRGDSIVDLGCGTGEDAVFLAARGIRVMGTDSSAEMVDEAGRRGVDARVLRIENIGTLVTKFDGALSNFGALNCVARVSDIREPLGRLVRSGGRLVVCVMGPFCLWETTWYALHGQFLKAGRRWKGEASSSLGLSVFYPTIRELAAALSPEFRLESAVGIGVFVPPSYVRGLSPRVLEWLGRLDTRVASWPGVRSLSDHRLLVFRRI